MFSHGEAWCSSMMLYVILMSVKLPNSLMTSNLRIPYCFELFDHRNPSTPVGLAISFLQLYFFLLDFDHILLFLLGSLYLVPKYYANAGKISQ